MTPTETASPPQRRQPLTPAERNQRRRLIFQDSLALLSLTAIAICMGVGTYFFFHSFRAHRSVLERRWYARGERALTAGNPQGAVQAFRSALSLSTGNSAYELSLAEALAAAGRYDEAYAYFSSLHDAKPGDGFLNLQLARLEVKRKNPARAVEFYRAALTGLWYGRGATQRFQIRLELAKYLMTWGENTQAQGDLLTAEGNSLDHPAQLLEVANLLVEAGDPSDAFTTFRRVERHAGATPAEVLQSLLGEAQVSAALGQYRRAALALDRYNARARQHPSAAPAEQRRSAQQQLNHLQHLLQLVPFSSLPPRQRADRVLLAATLAHKRYLACTAQLQSAATPGQNPSSGDTAAVAALGNQWNQVQPVRLRKLADNPALQQDLITWASETEILTVKLCGAPSGDDALLLQLARIPDKNE